MGWRPYWPLLTNIVHGIGHTELKGDFTVSSFNDYDHGICILIEGVARYFQYLQAHGGPDFSAHDTAAQACQANDDLNWLFHFLDDFGFMYWDFRQAIRANDSELCDLTWRECISFMHTSESNKTQYAPMAILRIFWAHALVEPLARIYHRNRTVSLLGLPGSNVGWDMVVEKENLMIRQNVIRASIERITRYVRRLNFTSWVSRAMERVMYAHTQRRPHRMKAISADVQSVVDHLIRIRGHTWAAASAPGPTLLVNPARSAKPWESVLRSVRNGSLDTWMRGHVATKIRWM